MIQLYMCGGGGRAWQPGHLHRHPKQRVHADRNQRLPHQPRRGRYRNTRHQ